MPRTIVIAAMTLLLVAANSASAQTFKLDPVHSFLVFRIKHLDVGYVWGRAVGPTGTLVLDDAQPANSSVEILAQAQSIDTGHEGRDKHIKGPDFFDSQQFPVLSFKSTSVKKTGDDTYEAVGELTLHGVAKPLTVTLTRTGEGDKGGRLGYRAGYETTFTINRSDFGITAMTNAIGEQVEVFVNLESVRQ